jgi:hypothetical protein
MTLGDTEPASKSLLSQLVLISDPEDPSARFFSDFLHFTPYLVT